MPNGRRASWFEREVRWTLQSREEIAIANAPYFRLLVSEFGEEQAKSWIGSYLDDVESEIKQVGEPGQQITRLVKMLQLEGGLRFWPFIARTKSHEHPKDPINAIFWNFGSPVIVADLLSESAGGWDSTRGVTMYALIDDTDHGGRCDWKPFDTQLRRGSFWDRSTHVRFYGGQRPCSHGKRAYSLAAVHKEEFKKLRGIHKPTSWDDARGELEKGLGSRGVVASTSRAELDTPGQLQGIPYDGEAIYVEIASPDWLRAVV